MLSCNIVQISHYESMMATIEGKLQEADTISVYGISTTEAFALHGERSSAQEILIELNAESNTLTMQIMTTNEEMINIGNTLRIVQQQASEFNGQKIRLDAYRRQVEARQTLDRALLSPPPPRAPGDSPGEFASASTTPRPSTPRDAARPDTFAPPVHPNPTPISPLETCVPPSIARTAPAPIPPAAWSPSGCSG